MNIYITKDNEESLRGVTDFTMSGLVNFLLEGYFKRTPAGEIQKIDQTAQKLVSEYQAKATNPNACKKCGSILVAGKCLTKHGG